MDAANGASSVSQRTVAETSMRKLKKLDKVAYVRFASVYRSFEDIDGFNALVNELQRQNTTYQPQTTTCQLRSVKLGISDQNAYVMKKSDGFTLIELLVAIAIAAILVMLAAPSFKGLIQSNTISSNVNSFLADMRYARSEAIRRGGGVIMCRSDSPEAASPVCGSGSGPGGNGWVSGWIIFHDMDGDGTRIATSTDPVLRVQSPITSMDSIVEPSSTKFRFTATGRLRSLSSAATTLQFGGGNYANTVQRVVCVNVGGRARVAGDGYASC